MQGQPPARQKSASPAAAESAATPTYTIGQLAALAGLPVKTIRFYSDSGVLPASRSPPGHRRYAEDALARLHLVRSLRDLDLDLPTIKHVLEGRRDLSGVLAAHVAALETRIQALRRQVVVLRAVAGHPDEAARRRVHQLWR